MCLSLSLSLYISLYIYTHIHDISMYIYVCMYIHICIYIYIYIYICTYIHHILQYMILSYSMLCCIMLTVRPRRHQTCHFRKRATSAPAEGPAYGFDFARHGEFPLRALQAQKWHVGRSRTFVAA